MSNPKENPLFRAVDTLNLQSRYEKEYPQAMSILRLGGVYPGEQQVITNPYTGEIHSAYFGNVGEHCMAVAGAAESIARAIPNLASIRRRSIVERASQ